jgi:hypothetical protein
MWGVARGGAKLMIMTGAEDDEFPLYRVMYVLWCLLCCFCFFLGEGGGCEAPRDTSKGVSGWMRGLGAALLKEARG